jgi:Zn-finger nucleic acid-binding protein
MKKDALPEIPDLQVDHCDSCDALWFDGRELERIVQKLKLLQA